MTVAIVIPLKSQKVSKSWKEVCDSLSRSLKCLTRQTNQSYIALIVGNEKPEGIDHFLSDKIRFHSVNFPPPNNKSPNFHPLEYDFDKNKKIAVGVQILKSNFINIKYWYQLDSDDLVSNVFIEKILDYPDSPGFIIERGYFYYQKQNRLIEANNLSNHCGSIGVIADKYMTSSDKNLLEIENIEKENIKKVPWCRYAHVKYYDFFRNELNLEPIILEDRVLCYVLANGNNISDVRRNTKWIQFKQFIKPYLVGEKVNKKHTQLFSIK